MSFVINESYSARSGLDTVARGLQSLIEERFELTVGLRNTGGKPTVGKSSNLATASQRGGRLGVCRRGGLYDAPASRQQLPKRRQRLSPFAGSDETE